MEHTIARMAQIQNERHCLPLKELQAIGSYEQVKGSYCCYQRFFVFVFCRGEGGKESPPCFSFCDSEIKFKNTNENRLCARLSARDVGRNK